MIEWELTLNCNFKCDYCTNGRNNVLSQKIYEETDKEKLKNFIKKLKTFNDTIYLYGGEPLLNKNIDFILNELIKNDIDFVIQSNFSVYQKIESLINNFKNIKFWISIHRTQIKNIDLHLNFIKQYINNIKMIDVVFTDYKDIKLFHKINEFFEQTKLIPVADFATSRIKYRKTLYLYNKLRKLKIPDVKFETDDRSFIWEKQMKGEIKIQGRPCICYNQFIMFSPNLKQFHCPQRFNGKFCPFETCYNLDKEIKFDNI